MACYYSKYFFGYKVAALFLLMTVTVLAMLFDILPVLVAAILSALVWDFFFIPPTFTFHIENAEDSLIFIMYFLIAMVNAVLTFKIRDAETKARDKEEKETTIKLYNTLLNSLSHEMRTPISTIIGAIDTLKENNRHLTEEKKDQLLTEIDIATIRLHRQVTNLLNMSRLETGMMPLKKDWCDINELIFSQIHKFPEFSDQHTILFTPDEKLPLFKLDAGLIENVLHNLIHNSIQYTPQGSAIRVEAMFRNEQLCLIISDNGEGFPESEIQYAFDKFYRLPNSKAGGTGLGLSIVKGFVMAHNGTVTLENNPQGGARFTLWIPAETSFISNFKNE